MMGMTGKKETGATWHHTTVILRSDIYHKAVEQGIDVSDACNQALAAITGTSYHREQVDAIPDTPPVIIARDGAAPHAHGETPKAPSKKLHPVINADDPAAPSTVVQAKVRPVKKAPVEPPEPHPDPVLALPEEKPAPVPAPTTKKAAVSKRGGLPQKKRSKGDVLKTFFTEKIARTDDADALLGKDDLYELFARFCRDHRITPVPERKAVTIALKNQFALSEKISDGTSCWSGIRLK
jgi:hypothetical protein